MATADASTDAREPFGLVRGTVSQLHSDGGRGGGPIHVVCLHGYMVKIEKRLSPPSLHATGSATAIPSFALVS